MNESRRSVCRIFASAALGAGLAVFAGEWMSEAEAQVQGGFASADRNAIPAIEIREGSIALVRANGGQYFVIDRQGNGYPVRFRDSDLVMPVGSTLLQSP